MPEISTGHPTPPDGLSSNGQAIFINPVLRNSMQNDQQIEQEIQAKGLTAPRITPDQIKALMKRVTYSVVVPEGTTSTFAHAYLDGRFFLASGHSACVSPENFNAEIGKDIALGKAESAAQDKLWELEGYLLYAGIMENVALFKEPA